MSEHTEEHMCMSTYGPKHKISYNPEKEGEMEKMRDVLLSERVRTDRAGEMLLCL